MEDTSDDSDTSELRFGFYVAELGTNIISASLAILVDDVSLQYVAHSERIDIVSIIIIVC